MILNYIVWDLDPEIFKLGSLPIRWYGLLFVITFIIAPKIATYIYKTEGRPLKDVETATIYCMIGTIIGARLGHVIFYDLYYYLQHPIEALLPISLTPSLHFTGYRGLASHGGALGLIITTYLYCNYDIKIGLFPPKFYIKKIRRIGQSYRWMGDIIAIFCALAAFCIRMGNFSNSEIYGKTTDKSYGVVFAFNIEEQLKNVAPAIEKISIKKDQDNKNENSKYQPIKIIASFRKAPFQKDDIKNYIEKNVRHQLIYDGRITRHVYQKEGDTLNYTISKDNDNRYVATIHTLGIPRHASQLYESLSSLLLFFLLFFWWKYRWRKIKEGTICGVFWILVFGLRFFYEFLKLGDIPFPDLININRAQILSIAGIIFGILFIIFANGYHKDLNKNTENEK